MLLWASWMSLNQALAANPGWEKTVEKSIDAVVQLKVAAPISFDTEGPSTSQGTGFIVDRERGLLLTNRHLVQPGPVRAEAIFSNNEELELRAVYRDPIHDFGFFQFDPDALQYLSPPELELNPDGAKVGVEIRILGNDAGEKLSILSGTLARLDRSAPVYGRGSYNDFNTFYYQAASGTSGGSSGSPVLNQQGEVIALNAGGASRAASSFYLPLDRVVRALEKIQAGEEVTRGTLQWTLQHRSYDLLRRLGLSEESEARLREAFPRALGALVVQDLVPGGPAAEGGLLPGDILLSLNEELLNEFIPLEASLDQAVGAQVKLGIERGGQRMEIQLKVDDLHRITPSEYLQVGRAVLHPLSYQQARNYNLPVQGLYVATPGYLLDKAGVPDGALITELAGERVDSLESFEAAWLRQAEGARVSLRYRELQPPHEERLSVLSIDRTWFPMQRCRLEGRSGDWPCTPSAENPPPIPALSQSADLSIDGPKAVKRVAPSLVFVEYSIPYPVEGAANVFYNGTGLVLDAERGLVLVDQNTVPSQLGDLSLTFGGAAKIPAEVFSIHPFHGMAVLRYDPALLGDTAVRSAVLGEGELEVGDSVWQIGLDSTQQVVYQETSIERRRDVQFPRPDVPRFRETNIETLRLTQSVPSVGAVLTDSKGRIMGLWHSHLTHKERGSAIFAGVPVGYLHALMRTLGHEEPLYRSLGVELERVSLSKARELGLPEEESQSMTEGRRSVRKLLSVRRIRPDAPAHGLLSVGDILLSSEGEYLEDFLSLETLGEAEEVSLRVLRQGHVLDLTVPTLALDGRGVSEVLIWSGAALHMPHVQVAQQREAPPDGVYVSRYWYGSPASRYGLRATRLITHVNGQPIDSLESFKEAVRELDPGSAVRIQLETLQGRQRMITLKPDPVFWPSYSLKRIDGQWQRVPLSSESDSEEAG